MAARCQRCRQCALFGIAIARCAHLFIGIVDKQHIRIFPTVEYRLTRDPGRPAGEPALPDAAPKVMTCKDVDKTEGMLKLSILQPRHHQFGRIIAALPQSRFDNARSTIN